VANFSVFVARKFVEGKTFISEVAAVNICWVAHIFLRISSDAPVCVLELLLNL